MKKGMLALPDALEDSSDVVTSDAISLLRFSNISSATVTKIAPEIKVMIKGITGRNHQNFIPELINASRIRLAHEVLSLGFFPTILSE